MGFLNEHNSYLFDPGDGEDPWHPTVTPPPITPPITTPIITTTSGGQTAQQNGGGGGGAGAFDLGAFPSFDFGQVPGFDAPEFTAPTPESVLSSPDYQTRLKSGTDALEASAAARGMLRTGGTLKDIIDYGKKFGQGEYDSSYSHSLQGYQTNYQRLRDMYAPKLAGWQANAQAALAKALAIYGRGTAWNMPHGGGGGGGVPDDEPIWNSQPWGH